MPTLESGEREPRKGLGKLDENADSLYHARIDHQDPTLFEQPETCEWRAAVDRGMDHGSFATQALPNIPLHVSTDGDNRPRAADDVRSLLVGVPACRAERIELRRVRQVNQPVWGGAVSFAQQQVAQILGRHQDKIGMEALNLLGQNSPAPDQVFHRENADALLHRSR